MIEDQRGGGYNYNGCTTPPPEPPPYGGVGIPPSLPPIKAK